ncbi:MAG: hypothetical protein H6Q66_2513 [Firmicutes bacterium]|nr:hypothetical protein [Bacillota bacterium]
MDDMLFAKLFAKLTIVLIAMSVSYISLTKLAELLQRKAWEGQPLSIIQKSIPFARAIHEYTGMGIGITAIAHAYFVFKIYPMDGYRVYLGLTAAIIFVLVALLGLVLLKNPSVLRVRYGHRITVILFNIALFFHRFVN